MDIKIRLSLLDPLYSGEIKIYVNAKAWYNQYTIFSVARGIGELDLNQPPPAPENKFNAYDLSPFLILDCRGEDAYQQCHILPGK